MKVTINPLDTVFVRDGRAFGENDAHAADSVFPPPPRVVFGAWRGAILTAGGYQTSIWGEGSPPASASWPDWFGDGKKAGSLRQKGPAVYHLEHGLLFPVPADCILDEDKGTLRPLPLAKTPRGLCSLDTPFCLRVPPKEGRLPKQKEPAYLSGTKLQECLASSKRMELPAQRGSDYHPIRSLWAREYRTHVGISPLTYAHVPRRLFSLGHTRPARQSLLFCQWEITETSAQEALDMVEQGKIRLINLGGEKRAAEVRPRSDIDWPAPPTGLVQEDEWLYFRIYLATPAYFDQGWQPKPGENPPRPVLCSDTVILCSDTVNIPVEIRAAAVGKPFHLGGFDIAGNRQRAIRRFVPAGSVYFLRTQADSEQVMKLHTSNLGDDSFLRAQGFGLAFLGALSPGDFGGGPETSLHKQGEDDV